jgi:hypothetical protein
MLDQPTDKKAKNMKRTFFGSLFVITLAVALPARAQTNLPPVDNSTFFASAMSYFSQFNPAYEETFHSNHFAAWTGLSSVQGAGVPLQNEIGLSWAVVKETLSVEAVVHDSGVTGTLVNVQAGLGVNKIVHDVKLTAYVHGGYNISRDVRGDKGYALVGVRVAKALTLHTFAGLGAGVRLPRGDREFTAFTGFVF